jgi:hypothetical protein
MSPTGNRINDRSSHDVDAVRCREIASLLRGARRVVSNYAETDPTWDGAVHSQLAAERLLAHGVGGEPHVIALVQAISIAQLYVFLMLQHLDALSMLFEGDPPPAYTIGLVARSIVEVGARAWWITDPDVTEDVRVARGFVEKLASLRDVDRSSNDTDGRISLSAVGLSHDAEALIAHISSLGITVDAKRGSVGGQIRPSATKLVGQFLEDDMPESCRAIYPLLSANVHGTLWAITLHFIADSPDAAQRKNATYRVTQGWLDGPANVALLALCWTLERLSTLMGWSTEPVLELMRRADDLFG